MSLLSAFTPALRSTTDSSLTNRVVSAADERSSLTSRDLGASRTENVQDLVGEHQLHNKFPVTPVQLAVRSDVGHCIGAVVEPNGGVPAELRQDRGQFWQGAQRTLELICYDRLGRWRGQRSTCSQRALYPLVSRDGDDTQSNNRNRSDLSQS